MPRLVEGKLAHTFPENWLVEKYDDWPFYCRQFKDSCGGNKAMDFLGFDPDDRTLWMIELKDYRQFRRTKDDMIELWTEVSIKARDTLAGLFAAKVQSGHDNQVFARKSVTAAKIRVVLHLEQPLFHSKLFPRVYDPADIQQKLKQLIKPIDAHPLVIELQRMNHVPFSGESVP